jgi:hypothetical protein
MSVTRIHHGFQCVQLSRNGFNPLLLHRDHWLSDLPTPLWERTAAPPMVFGTMGPALQHHLALLYDADVVLLRVAVVLFRHRCQYVSPDPNIIKVLY